MTSGKAPKRARRAKPAHEPKPVPRIEPAMAPFFAAAKERRLVVQRCTGCGTLRFPAREVCTACLETAAEWIPVSGRGEIFSFNVMHQVYDPAFAGAVPYAGAIVELTEGPRLTTSLVDCPPEAVRIGARVEVVFDDLSDEVTLPRFRLAP